MKNNPKSVPSIGKHEGRSSTGTKRVDQNSHCTVNYKHLLTHFLKLPKLTKKTFFIASAELRSRFKLVGSCYPRSQPGLVTNP